MSALFDNKRCVICDRFIPQKPRYRDVHINMHVRRGEAEIKFVNHRQYVVVTEKAEAATPSKDVTATAGAENEPLHNAEVNSAPRI